jgi:hypothetical protein
MIASGSEVVIVVNAVVAATSGVATAAYGSVDDWA